MSAITERAPQPKELKGHFKIDLKDKDNNLVDSYEDNNLIVINARKKMAALLGSKDRKGVTRILLGTRGHNTTTGNILEPKEVGQDGYDENRQQIFSVEELGQFYYTILWDPDNLVDESGAPAVWVDNRIHFVARGNPLGGSTENAAIPVTITLTDNIVEFNFEVPETAGNGTDGSSVVAYTEAGLYCENSLFSIKCYPAKVKDINTQLSVVWRIIF